MGSAPTQFPTPTPRAGFVSQRLAYTVNECAELSGYCAGFIYGQVRTGKLRKLPGKGRSVRIARSEFETWLYGETLSQIENKPEQVRVSQRTRQIVDVLLRPVA